MPDDLEISRRSLFLGFWRCCLIEISLPHRLLKTTQKIRDSEELGS